MSNKDALKDEVSQRLEAMKATWRILELIGVQDAAEGLVLPDEHAKDKLEEERCGILQPDNIESSTT
jgi:hypothetical protein